MSAREWTLETLAVGTEARFEQRIEGTEVDKFACLSGDQNPLHTDRQFARRAGFRDRIVHGALLGALASRLVGMELPGQHSLLLSLKLDFVAPTFPGDIVEVVGKVESIHAERQVVVVALKISCHGELRMRGSALVRLGHRLA